MRKWPPSSFTDRIASKSYNLGHANGKSTKDYIVSIFYQPCITPVIINSGSKLIRFRPNLILIYYYPEVIDSTGLIGDTRLRNILAIFIVWLFCENTNKNFDTILNYYINTGLVPVR